jgi:lipoprotein-releasing system permease protein
LEFFVAWRHLHSAWHPRKLWVIWAGVIILAAAGGVFWIALRLPPPLTEEQVTRALAWNLTAIGLGLVGWLTVVFGVFFQFMSIFTTISTFGVHLGTCAMVLALSVMTGFQEDLRSKILDSNAHLLITKEEGSFTEYKSVGKAIEGLCVPGTRDCVLAWTPYLTSEIVVAANQNYGSTLIKGIDPTTATTATKLAKHLGDQRGLERLWPLDPEGKPIPYEWGQAVPTPVDTPAPEEEEDEEPVDFSGGGEHEEIDEEAEPVDFSADAGIPMHVIPGEPRPLPPDPRLAALDGVLVGRELAKNLHLYTGQEVQVVSPLGKETPTGQIPRTKPFRVAGTFFTGMFEYDTKLVYVSLPALQAFLSLGDEVQGLEVRIANQDQTAGLIAEITNKLGKGYRVQGWQELNRSLFSALKLEKIAMFLVLAIIILVASFSIVSNLIMVVVEKARDVAVLKSLGARNVSVMGIFVVRGLYIGLIGTAVGLGIGIGVIGGVGAQGGIPLNPNVYYIDRLPIAIDLQACLFIAFAGIAISVIATIYPALVSAWLRPTDGLRKGN